MKYHLEALNDLKEWSRMASFKYKRDAETCFNLFIEYYPSREFRVVED